jgi:hypothetical protein
MPLPGEPLPTEGHRGSAVPQGSAGHAPDHQQSGIFEYDDRPFEPRHHLQADDGERGDCQIPQSAEEEYRHVVVDERRCQQIEAVDACRYRESGRAERVIQENHPARKKPQVGVKYLRHPGVRRTRTLVPAIESLVGDGDAHHRNKADEDGYDSAVAAHRNQSRQTHRDGLRWPRTGEAHDDGIA